MRFLFSLFIIAYVVLTSPFLAYAQTIDAKLRVLHPNSDPAANLWVSLNDGISDLYYITDSAGEVVVYGITEANYTLTLLPSYGGAPVYANYLDTFNTVGITILSPGYDTVNNIVDLGDFYLQPYPNVLKLTAENPLGAPVSGLRLEGYVISGVGGNYVNVEAPGSKISKGFTNEAVKYQLTLSSKGFTPHTFTFDPLADLLNQTIQLKPTESKLEVALVDNNGNAYPVPTFDYASVSCYSTSGPQSFTTTIPNEDSVVTLGMNSGSYDCSVYVTSFPTTKFEITLRKGDEKKTVVTLTQADAKITINLKDQYGSPYLNTSGSSSMNCDSADGRYSFYTSIPQNSSSVQLDVTSGPIECNPYIPNIPTDPVSVEALSGQTAEKDITVYTPDSSITLNLVDAVDRTPIVPPSGANAEVHCSEQNGFNYFNAKIPDGSAFVILPVIAGTYSCSSNIVGYSQSYVTVTVAASENKSSDLLIATLDAKINFSLFTPDGLQYQIPTGSNASVNCYNPLGGSNNFHASLQPGEVSASLDVVGGGYRCGIFGEGISAEEKAVKVDAGNTVEVSFIIVPEDRTLTVRFTNRLGEPVALSTEDRPSLSCYSNEGFSFSKQIPQSATEATLQMVAASFQCNLYGQGVSSDTFEVDMTSQQSVTRKVRVKVASTKLIVNLINGDTREVFKLGNSQYGNISCFDSNFSNPSNFYASIDPGSSSATVPVTPGTFECLVSIEGTSNKPFTVTTVDGQDTYMDVEILRPNSAVIIKLVNATTNEPFVLPLETFGSAGCQSAKIGPRSSYYSAPINPGDSEVRIPVREGDYRCDVWIDQYGSTSVKAQVVQGQQVEKSSKILTESASITVRLLDSVTNEPITGRAFDFSIWTAARLESQDRLNHNKFETSTTGEVTFSVLPGQYYEVSVARPFDQNDIGYVLPDDILIVLADENQPKVAELVAVPSTTFIEVNVTSPSGEALSSGWVNAYSSSTQLANTRSSGRLRAFSRKVRSFSKSSPTEDHWVGGQIINGTAKLAVLPGRTYEVTVYHDQELSQDWLPPQTVSVTPLEGQTVSVQAAFTTANVVLNITINEEGTAPANQTASTHCYAIDSDGRQSYASGYGSEALSLPIYVGEVPVPVQINCSSFYPDPLNDYGVNLWGEQTYVPSVGTTSDSVQITVREFGKYYPQESYTFDATKDVSFTLQDGQTSVEIPAKAVASSGDVTLIVGSGSGYSYKEESFPLLTFDFSFVQGEKKISNMEKPVTIRFPIDPARLAELGVDTSSLKAASFQGTSKVWRHDASYVVDAETNTLSVSVSHFSIWGLLIDLAKKVGVSDPGSTTPGEALNNIPTNLTATKVETTKKSKRTKKKRKKKGTSVKKNSKKKSKKKKKNRASKYDLCWDVPEAQIGLTPQYEVEYLTPKIVTKVKKAEKKKKAREKNKKKKKRKKKKRKKKKSRNRVSSTRITADHTAWDKARTIGSDENCTQVKITTSGKHHFRVKVVGGEFSEVLSFKARN